MVLFKMRETSSAVPLSTVELRHGNSVWGRTLWRRCNANLLSSGQNNMSTLAIVVGVVYNATHLQREGRQGVLELLGWLAE